MIFRLVDSPRSIQEEYENLLLEATKVGTQEFEELLKRYYPNVSSADAERLVKLDPTFKNDGTLGTYSKWILGIANKGNGKIDNEGHLRDVLVRFEEEKNGLVNKDIMKFKTVDDVETMLNDDNSYKDLSHRQEVRQRQKDRKNADIEKDAKKVYEDSDWVVYVPQTYAASCKLGQGTTWCTASTESDYYYNYYKNNYGGDYYINISKHDPEEKYQFHFPTGQFMDRDDGSIELSSFMRENDGLRDFYYEREVKPLISNLGDELKLNKESIASAIANAYSYNRDSLPEDFITECLLGNAIEYFIDSYDGWGNADHSYFINYVLDTEYWYPKIKECYIKNNGTADSDEYEDLSTEEQIEYFIDNDDDINMAFSTAYTNAEEVGSASEAEDDVINGVVDALPYFVSSDYGRIFNGGSAYSIVNIDKEKFDSNLKSDWYKYNMDFETLYQTDGIYDIIYDFIKDNFRVYEPRYGWQGFDKSTFDDVLSDELSSLTESIKETKKTRIKENKGSPTFKFKLAK